MPRTSDLTSWTCSSSPFICSRSASSAQDGPQQVQITTVSTTVRKVLSIGRVLTALAPRSRRPGAPRDSPSNGLDSGGPAIVGPKPFRPETLRRHLSMDLPLSESRREYTGLRPRLGSPISRVVVVASADVRLNAAPRTTYGEWGMRFGPRTWAIAPHGAGV